MLVHGQLGVKLNSQVYRMCVFIQSNVIYLKGEVSVIYFIAVRED